MIEDLEAELNGSLKETSNTEISAVAEEANVDNAINLESKDSNKMEIDIKYEQSIKAYEETMEIDIENINTIKNRNKLYTTQRRTIYKGIEPDFFLEI